MAQVARVDIEQGGLDTNIEVAKGTGQTQPCFRYIDDGTPPLVLQATDVAGKTIARHQIIAKKTAAYTVLLPTNQPHTNGDHFVPVDGSGGSFTVTLPLSASAGAGYSVRVMPVVAPGANTVTIAPSGADAITGPTTITGAAGTATNKLLTFVADGTATWFSA